MREPIVEGIDALLRSAAFVRHYPRFVHVLSRMQVVANPGVPVMAVSPWGRLFRLHVNPTFFAEQPGFVPGVLVHEVQHVLLGHVTHRKFRAVGCPPLMNLAMEASANEYIADPLPGDPVTVEKLARYGIRPGQSTLERYRLLLKHAKPIELSELLRGAFHGPIVRSGEADCGHGSGAGDLIDRLTGDVPSPSRLDWRTELQCFVSRLRTPQPDWLRPPRRYPHLLGVMPGSRRMADPRTTPKLLVAIDTSGSMSRSTLEQVGAELQRVARWARLTIVECDASIQRVYPFQGALPEIVGRGGTNLRPPFEPAFLAEQRPDGVVYFTDGRGPWPPSDPGVRTLWVLTEPRPFDCPWGRQVILDPLAPGNTAPGKVPSWTPGSAPSPPRPAEDSWSPVDDVQQPLPF